MGIFDIIGPVMVGPSSSHTAWGGENWFCGKKSAGRRCERGKDPPLWILSCNRERAWNG